MNKNFSYYITNFFAEYLPSNIGASENTIKSYRDTFVQLISFLENNLKFNINSLTFENIDKDVIQKFIMFLEDSKHISIATRNQRLAAIHSFFKYLSQRELQYFNKSKDILNIEYKKVPVRIMSYLSLEEIKFLFSIPNVDLKNEFRDLALLVVLYDTGARVQEIIELKLNSIHLDNKPLIYLHGKGNKTRVVPINSNTANIIKKYLHDNKILAEDEIIFKNKQSMQLTRVGIQYIINKYIERAKEINPHFFKNKISPHSFRHSKAMHLLEADVNLIYIRDLLGHTSVVTTEIYAKTNPEIKRKFIEKNSISINADCKYTANKKDELKKWLLDNI